MTSASLREQAAQKEREWRELEQLQYDFVYWFIHLFHFIFFQHYCHFEIWTLFSKVDMGWCSAVFCNLI